MKEQTITRETVSQFENHLRMEKKAQNTIEKYMRDITTFAEYLWILRNSGNEEHNGRMEWVVTPKNTNVYLETVEEA